jgi:hypothetical protein
MDGKLRSPTGGYNCHLRQLMAVLQEHCHLRHRHLKSGCCYCYFRHRHHLNRYVAQQQEPIEKRRTKLQQWPQLIFYIKFSSSENINDRNGKFRQRPKAKRFKTAVIIYKYNQKSGLWLLR